MTSAILRQRGETAVADLLSISREVIPITNSWCLRNGISIGGDLLSPLYNISRYIPYRNVKGIPESGTQPLRITHNLMHHNAASNPLGLS